MLEECPHQQRLSETQNADIEAFFLEGLPVSGRVAVFGDSVASPEIISQFRHFLSDYNEIISEFK